MWRGCGICSSPPPLFFPPPSRPPVGGKITCCPSLAEVAPPVRLRSTLWWNPPNTLLMRGVITHVSKPYSITDWTTAKYIWPEVWASAHSLPSTLDIRAHFCCDFRRLLTTNVQSWSVDEITLPRYLKRVNGARGIPYSLILLIWLRKMTNNWNLLILKIKMTDS